MRRAIYIFFIAALSCGDGGPAEISASTGGELAVIFGPQYELAYLRTGERPRAGAAAGDVVVSLGDITSGCSRVCTAATSCLDVDGVGLCVSRCVGQVLGEPAGCALPSLDALLCAVEGICSLPLDQRGHFRERILSCGLEYGEITAARPGVLASDYICELPEF